MLDIVHISVSQTQAPTPNDLQKRGLIISNGATNADIGAPFMVYGVADLDDYFVDIPEPPPEIEQPTNGGSDVNGEDGNNGGDLTDNTSDEQDANGNGNGNGNNNGKSGPRTPVKRGPQLPAPKAPATNGLPPLMQAASAMSLDVDSDALKAQLKGRVEKYFENNKSGNPVFILEIGKVDSAAGVAYLKTWLEENVNQFYIINLPTGYDAEATLIDLVKEYENTEDKQYFSFGVSKTSYFPYKGIKSCICCVSNNDKEYVDVAPMAILNSYDPGPIQKATPLAFRYVFGYSPYLANNPTLGQLKKDFVNYIDTGAEGGISNNLIKWGTTMDGRDALYWYAVDWIIIAAKLNLANEVINGSNNTQNPLFYNQRGIDRLDARLDKVMTNAVDFGIALQGFVITAVPFKPYVTAKPEDFKIGTYAGLGITCTPNRGFLQIYIAIDVTDFA